MTMEMGLGRLQDVEAGRGTSGHQGIHVGDEEAETDPGRTGSIPGDRLHGLGLFLQQEERAVGQTEFQVSASSGGRIDEVVQFHGPEGLGVAP